MQRDNELDDFKQRVNLSEYAAAQGYALDRRASSRNSVTMRHPSGDKIIVAKDHDGHWVYFSVHDQADHGSIVDFVQRRDGGSLGDVRKTLRRWTGDTSTRPPPSTFVRELQHLPRDLAAVRATYEAAWPIAGRHEYLETARRIPAALLADPILADRIRENRFGNAVFPHFNPSGLCGYELKGHNFTGFAPGGIKGLWITRPSLAGDSRLVIAETAVDALSYAALKGEAGTRYSSIGGEMNPHQPELIAATAATLPQGSCVILAMDNDAGGELIAAKVRTAVTLADRPDLAVVDDRPAIAGQDWNDVLRTRPAPARARLFQP